MICPENKIYLSPPHMGSQEQEFIKEVFETNWIAPLGPAVDGFEADLRKYTGVRSVAALSSGTAAIHLALALLGVKAGDFVICQSLTFAASAYPIIYQGATPVFTDSEDLTWNMSPFHLEKAIKACINGEVKPMFNTGKSNKKGKHPRAIIVVDLYGMPAGMEEILSVASRYNIPVIEDAAEALGSHINGKMCGTFGSLGILSFNGNKIITTSGGGALLSDNEEMITRARFLACQARDKAPHYQHSEIGFNYRMSNVSAAIGRGQMLVLEKRIESRRANFEKYRKWFKNLDKKGYRFGFQPEPQGFFSNRWLTVLLFDPKANKGLCVEKIRKKLDDGNIESRPVWKPMHLQPVFGGASFFGDGTAEHLFNCGLCLPSGSNLEEADFERIFQNFKAIFE